MGGIMGRAVGEMRKLGTKESVEKQNPGRPAEKMGLTPQIGRKWGKKKVQ